MTDTPRKLAGRVVQVQRTRDDGKLMDRWQFLVLLDNGETVEIDAAVFDNDTMDAEFYRYSYINKPVPFS